MRLSVWFSRRMRATSTSHHTGSSLHCARRNNAPALLRLECRRDAPARSNVPSARLLHLLTIQPALLRSSSTNRLRRIKRHQLIIILKPSRPHKRV